MMPADYSLRYSRKAKYLHIRVSPKGVEVIIPHGKRLLRTEIHDFVLQKKPWIEKTQKRYLIEQKDVVVEKLPIQMHLQAINQSWDIIYIPSSTRLSLYANATHQIKLVGDTMNENACIELLKQWLKKTAKYHLSNMLQQISYEVAIPFRAVSIRNNTTRWGSCTHQKNISLCCRLLFLPTHLVKHVLLHELCHTKIMHHGKDFWNLLKKLDENTQSHVKELKRSTPFIPSWIR